MTSRTKSSLDGYFRPAHRQANLINVEGSTGELLLTRVDQAKRIISHYDTRSPTE